MIVPRSWLRNPISWPPLTVWKQNSAEADHLLGHNIIRHDLPHLVAMRPALANIFRSPIDTLWLNPLAFPRNPYHHLVKHYHDGRLVTIPEPTYRNASQRRARPTLAGLARLPDGGERTSGLHCRRAGR